MTELPKSSESWPARIAWAKDQSGLHVTMNWEGAPQWITLPDLARHPGIKEPPSPLEEARNRPPACPVVPMTARWGTTIRMVPASALDGGAQKLQQDGELDKVPGTTVVTLQGRKRGFHDYQDDFYGVISSPGCGYVLFEHEGAVWIADGKGGAASPVLKGGGFLFFAR